MTTPAARVFLSVPGTGGHGPARLAAVGVLVQALGCRIEDREPLTGFRRRGPAGDYYVTVWGPADVVAWLRDAWPAIIGKLDKAAADATRGYAAWLRHDCPEDDHMPAERAGLRARWRREYLRVYGETLAARIRAGYGPVQDATRPGGLYRAHRAWQAAELDAGRASLAGYLPPPERNVAEASGLLVVAGARRRAVRPSRPGTKALGR